MGTATRKTVKVRFAAYCQNNGGGSASLRLFKNRKLADAVAEKDDERFADGDVDEYLLEVDCETGEIVDGVQATVELDGKIFVVTGTLSGCTRAQAEARIIETGAFVASRVSKNIDILVVGDKPGSKLEKARSLGIKIISENELEQLLTGELV